MKIFKEKRVTALIPARSGSKGLPGKNIIMFHNKPLIAWTIEAALGSAFIDEVVVSTDSQEIADIASEYRVSVPWLRPLSLSGDGAVMTDVVFHALAELEASGSLPDFVVLLQPTSPLRISKDIDNAISMLDREEVKAVASVSPVQHHPGLTNVLPSDGSLKDFIDVNVEKKNRQEVTQYYSLNGAIYLSEIQRLKEVGGFFSSSTYAYIMPRERSIDIDNGVDLILAECLMKFQDNQK